MSDDESRQEAENRPSDDRQRQEAFKFEAPSEATTAEDRANAKQRASDEAKRVMEEKKREKSERQIQELAEYEEMRRDEREKEEADIKALREKRIQRKLERVEEERKLMDMRASEEARRKAEEEERKRTKLEQETQVREERDRKKKEAEDRLKPKKPNYVIHKKEGGDESKAQASGPLTKDDMQKSKEQLEEEKQAILSQRIQALTIEGFNAAKLADKAKELTETMRRLEGEKYDNEQRYKQQQYDMIELAERARQMTKGKGKRGAVSSVQVDESFDRLADKYTSAPPKIEIASKYERRLDHRTFTDKMSYFQGGDEPEKS